MDRSFTGYVYSMEMLLSLVLFVIYQPRRKNFVIKSAIGLTVYVGLEILTVRLVLTGGNLFAYGGTLFFLTALYLTLFVWFAFDTDFFGALYLITGTYAVQHMGYSAAKIIRMGFSPSMPQWLSLILSDFIVYIVVGGIVFFVFIFTHRHHYVENTHDKRALTLSLCSLVLCILLNAWVEPIFHSITVGPQIDYLHICCNIYSIIGCAFTLFLQFGFKRENKLSAEKEILDRLLYEEKKQHELSKSTIEIINAKSHDLKNQIALLANIDDKKARQDYIEEIKKHVAIYDSEAVTGNAALDIILSEKSLFCEKNNISLSYLADGRKISFMNAADIASLFGNALDNAIESLLQEEEERRFISITVKEENGFVYLHIDNYCSRDLRFVDGLPQTTKENKQFHGYGAKSIRSVVLKYGGDMCMEVRDGRFNLDVIIPSPNTAETDGEG